jgi:alpha-ribazole phosphatase/probable phosphoglycerate mutase
LKITLVRHAEVEETYQGCYNGHIDIGLSKNGEEQAKILANKLSSSPFDAVYCSDLLRAKMTIKPFIQEREAIYTDKLREKSWGKHEGLKFDEIIASGEVEYINFLQWIDTLDGEPYEEYLQRVKEFFLIFLPSQKRENILVVTHGGVIRTLISIVKKISLEEAFGVKVENASFILFYSIEKTFTYGETNENI